MKALALGTLSVVEETMLTLLITIMRQAVTETEVTRIRLNTYSSHHIIPQQARLDHYDLL